MSDESAVQQAISAALKQVQDPHAGRDVVSLGYVRHVAHCDGVVRVTFEAPKEKLTEAFRLQMTERVRQALLEVEGLKEVTVEYGVKPPPRATSNLPGVKHVIAVGAGKGGVGKSTVAALLAVGLQRRGLAVGLLDADVYGPSLPKITGTESLVPEANPETGQIYPPERDGLRIMSMGYIIPKTQAVVWRGPMAQKYIKEFLDRGVWGELDYLIVDLPPGTGDIPLTLAQSIPLTGAVVVCTPQDVALLDATKAVRMYQKLNVEPLGMVENMSMYCCPNCGHAEAIFGHGGAQAAAGELEIPFLGEIPLNVGIRMKGDEGDPFAVFDSGEPPIVQALDSLVSNVKQQVEQRVRQRSPLPQLKVSG